MIGYAVDSVRTINAISITNTINCHEQAIIGRMKIASFERFLYFARDRLRWTSVNVLT